MAPKTKAKAARSKSAGAKKRSKKATRRSAPSRPKGAIAHTELASADPAATKVWAQKALGWKFEAPMPMPGGEYYMWQAGKENGGGIRSNMPPETPGTLIYVEVANIRSAYETALKHGAKPMMPPKAIGKGMGSMAVVNAPGGVAIGLWSRK